MSFNLVVTFENIDATRTKAFVNSEFMGYVRVIKGRLTFRNSNDCFKTFLRVPHWIDLDRSVPEIVNDPIVMNQLIPAVIRTFMRKTSFARDVLAA